jgi:hypothetical protein
MYGDPEAALISRDNINFGFVREPIACPENRLTGMDVRVDLDKVWFGYGLNGGEGHGSENYYVSRL